MSAERRGCGRIVHCRECKFGAEVSPTMFCLLLYEKPDWSLPEPYAGGEPCEHLEVSPDDFCAWGELTAANASSGRRPAATGDGGSRTRGPGL